jgi:negative regulator of sigma-B (phosphoserine phosphatase)
VRLVSEYLVRPRYGDTHCGDAVVIRSEARVDLVAVIDGLGHGERAEHAAQTGAELLREIPLDEQTTAFGLVQRVHNAMRGTRGAAGMVCVHQRGLFDCCGVGNVELRSNSSLGGVLTPGVLGQQTRRLRTCSSEVAPGTRIAVFTDGVSARFDMRTLDQMDLSQGCKYLIETYGHKQDDAAVVLSDIVLPPEEEL